MNLFKKLSIVTLASFALGCGTASASVVEHVQLGMESGITFDGNITFADHFASIEGVDGYLDGSGLSHDHLTWNYDAYYDDAIHATGIPGVLTDFLTDGDPRVDYQHYLGISWSAPGDMLSIDIASEVPTDYAGLDDKYRITSVTLGDATPPSNVPEPASMVLLGLGLAGLAAARRRKA